MQQHALNFVKFAESSSYAIHSLVSYTVLLDVIGVYGEVACAVAKHCALVRLLEHGTKHIFMFQKSNKLLLL